MKNCAYLPWVTFTFGELYPWLTRLSPFGAAVADDARGAGIEVTAEQSSTVAPS